MRRRLHVEENAVLVKREIHVGTPKTHEQRTVPYPPFLAPMIAEACAGKGPDDLLFGNGRTHTYADLFDDDLEAVATSMRLAAAAASVGNTWADRLA